MGVAGERNSRGDTNWVPAEAVERIEVLRGPAAARYGSGAAGGVVNIITKRPTGDLSGSMTLYGLVPEHSDEGGSQRAGFTLSGPLARDLSFRLYGNLNKTDADAPDINSAHSRSGSPPPAARACATRTSTACCAGTPATRRWSRWSPATAARATSSPANISTTPTPPWSARSATRPM